MTDKTNFQKVQEFHLAFNQTGIADKLDLNEMTPFWVRRTQLLNEEFHETQVAMGKYVQDKTRANMAEVVDGLLDMLYVIYGTAELMGVDVDAAFAEVHRSNMSKLDENGKPIINGENGVSDPEKPLFKVLKGPNYSKPNLDPYIIL